MYNNTDFLNYSDHEKKDYLLEKNQNGEYKRTEEERYNLIGYINDSNDVIKVAMTLSEEKRLDERIVNKLNNWDLAIMLMETANVEMIRKYISKISNFKRIEIISQDKFDNKTKVELIMYLDNDTDKIKIMEDIQDDELLKESLQYIKGESIKAKIINRISNVETRIILVKELQSSTERLNIFKTLDSETQIKYIDEFNLTDSQKKEVLTSKDETGTYKFNEEVRLDIIQNMNSSSDICSIAQTLSEEKRTDERILKKLNNWDLKQLIKTITNINLVISCFQYIKDNTKIEIIDQDKYSIKEKIELLKHVSEQHWKMNIINTFTEDETLEESLQCFTVDGYKSKIISRIKDIDTRVRLAKTLKEEIERYTVFKSLDSTNQVKYFNEFNLFDNHKKEFLTSKDQNNNYTVDEDTRLELIDFVKESTYVYNIAQTLSEEKRIDERVIKKLESWDLVKLANDITKSEFIERTLKYLPDYSIVEVINKSKLSSKEKVRLIKYIDAESERINVVKTITEDEQLEEALQYFNHEAYKTEIIKRVENKDTKIRLGMTLHNENERFNIFKTLDSQSQIENITNYNLRDIHIEEILTSKDENKKYKFNEDTILKVIEYMKDSQAILEVAKNLSEETRIDERVIGKLNNWNREELIQTLTNIDILKKGLVYLDEYRKVNIINKSKYPSDIKLKLIDTITNESYRMEVIKKFNGDKYLEEALQFIQNEEYKSKIINRIEDKTKKVVLATSILTRLKNLNDIKNFIRRFDSQTENVLYNKLNIMLENEKRLAKVYSYGEFAREFSNIKEYGSRYRILTTVSRIPEEAKINYISEFSDENDRLDILKSIILEENKIKAYNQRPLENESNKMKYIRLFNDSNKKEQLHILDNSIDKLIIVNEIVNKEQREEALKKIDNYKIVFNELFNNGEYSLISKFSDSTLESIFDSKQIKILHEYNKYTRDSIKKHYSEYIHNHYEQLDENQISTIATLVFNIDTSNSEEIGKQADSFIENILSSNDPLEKFNQVEKIFIQNHLPYFAKAYLTFLTVHPDFESYSFKNSKKGNHEVTSPVLNEASLLHKKTLILMDIIKCSLRANNINFQEYLNKLEYGNEIYMQYKNNKDVELTDEERILLEEFRGNLIALHDNMIQRKKYQTDGEILKDIENIENSLKINSESLPDYIIKSYLHFIGINSISDARKYIQESMKEENVKNNNLYQEKKYTIEQGDFVKGFNINYFFDMMQNGIVAKDYLGADMNTDCTALDTDLSRIFVDTSQMSINEIIDLKNRDTGMFGQGYIVIKDNPEKIRITKKSNNEPNSREEIITKQNMFEDKLEAFSNGVGTNISNPYGIRTGFPPTAIDYIVFDEEGGLYKNNIYKLILPMVMNGLYIPIISKNRVDEKGIPIELFTKEDYENLRNKMSGLNHYGINNFNISNNIDDEEYRKIASQIDDSNEVIGNIKRKIINEMQAALGEDYNIINHINGKLTKNELQVLDTGSTSRSTNVPYDGDYDFIVRINRDIDINEEIKKKFTQRLTSKFNIISQGRNVDGDIKEMVIQIGDKEYKLDLSFVRKTDKVSYSTEMCVQDRLNTIKLLYPDKYKLVLANIIYAKKYFKLEENSCYKKGCYGQGGLGGIGVENWILQNGGSFYDAAVDFISNAYTKDGEQLSFEQFKEKYFVWDFGENFYTDRKNNISSQKNNLHDNFIGQNLTAEGYNRMCKALNKFISDYKLGRLQDLTEAPKDEIEEVNIISTMK